MKEKNGSSRRRIVIIAVIAVEIMVIALIVLFVCWKRGVFDASKEETADKDLVRATEKSVEEDPYQKQLRLANEAWDDGYQILVAVPQEFLPLRSTPGFHDTEIDRFEPGTFMVWDGTSQVADEKTFYHVWALGEEQKGYVSSDYAVEVQFMYNGEDPWDIVDVGNALYTYDDMCEDIDQLCKTYGDLIHQNVLGHSVDGRDIIEVVLGSQDAPHQVMIQSGIHGREYMTVQLTMKMIEYYAYYAKNGTYDGISYEDLLQKVAFHVVPMSNPDGVSISQLGEDGLQHSSYEATLRECYERDKGLMVYDIEPDGEIVWYDNYKQIYDDLHIGEISYAEYLTNWKANANGVDLNVNFDAKWQELSVKDTPSFSKCRGYAPESEPETKLLADLARSEDFDCYISYHSTGNLIYYGGEGIALEVLAQSQELANRVNAVNRNELKMVASSATVNMGGFGDWVQLVLGKPSVTVEVGRNACPLKIEEFYQIWLQNREVWAAIAAGME